MLRDLVRLAISLILVATCCQALGADPGSAITLSTITVTATPPPSIENSGALFDNPLAYYGFLYQNLPFYTSTDPKKNKNGKKDSSDSVADPIIPSTAAKVKMETDFAMPGEMGLRFDRYYTSSNPTPGIFGNPNYRGQWTSSLSYIFSGGGCPSSPSGNISMTRPDRSVLSFEATNGAFSEQGGGVAQVSCHNDIWTVIDEDSHVLQFDSFGSILSIKDTHGIGWTITRPGTNTVVVTHTSGQVMTITYATTGLPDLIGTMTVTDPQGNIYTYKGIPGYGGAAGINYAEFLFSLINMNYSTVTLPGSPATIETYKYNSTDSSTTPSFELTEVDINGVAHDLTSYDSVGRATGTKFPDGTGNTSITYGTSSIGPTATVTNPLGHISIYQYNANNQLLSIQGQAAPATDVSATLLSRTFDTNGHISSENDNNGNVTNYTYAANGQLQTLVEAATTPVARTTQYVWDTTVGTNRPLTITVAGLSKTTYTYNAQNRLASLAVTNLSGNGSANQTLTTTYQYTQYANGMLHTITVIHPSPGSTNKDIYTYDALGNLTSEANGLGQTKTYSNYNALGEPAHIVGANGDVIDYTYDARARVVTKTTYPYGYAGTWTTTYDGTGLPHTLTTPDNEVLTWSRDPELRTLTILKNDKDGASTESFAYDANDDVVSHSVKRGSDVALSETALYDALGRIYKKKGAHGQVLTFGYDANNNLISTSNALGHTSNYQYDALNRVTRETNTMGGITKYLYDVGDRVISVMDPRGLNSSYVYDGLGYLWRQVSPDTGITQYTFDIYGRRSSMTRADGTLTSFTYDTLGRTTSISAHGQTQTFAFDNCTHGLGRLCTASDATGTTAYSYTPEGWVSGRGFTIGGTTYALGYNYDAIGRPTVVTYPDGYSAVYYRTNGVVSSVLLVHGGSYYAGASNITYRPGNLAMAGWTASNGLTNSINYDSDMRIIGISTPGVQNLAFSYDNANRTTKITNGMDSTLTQNFTYDALSRLSTVISGADNESYQYDADGNRITGTANGWPQTYMYGTTNNRLLSFSSVLSAQYGYDAQGNTSTVNGTATYQYTPFNRLLTSGGETDYVNPEGQRLRKAGGSTGTTYFAPDSNGDLEAENDSGTWVDYVRLNGRLIGRIKAGQIQAVHADQVDRPEVVTDASKTVVWRAQNFAFSSTVTTDNIGGLNLGFPGQYYDAERWLWNNGYRDYSSGFGRYIESDPTGLDGGVNTYVYANGNPLSGVDPLGQATAVLLGGKGGNLFGHVAIAFTGQGVFSYGTQEAFGSSTTEYLARQAKYRTTTVYILNTSPAQEQQMIDYLQANYTQPGQYSILTHDCATAVNRALLQAGIGQNTVQGVEVGGGVVFTNLPITASLLAGSFPGASSFEMPAGSAVPSSMSSFNPGSR